MSYNKRLSNQVNYALWKSEGNGGLTGAIWRVWLWWLEKFIPKG